MRVARELLDAIIEKRAVKDERGPRYDGRGEGEGEGEGHGRARCRAEIGGHGGEEGDDR